MIWPNINYLTDKEGKRTAVVISIQEWRSLQEELQLFRQQREIKEQIQSGLKDVKLWEKGEKELITFEEFLENEC